MAPSSQAEAAPSYAMASITPEQLTGAISHAFSDASDAVHATGTAIGDASNAAVQAAGSAISDVSHAAVQGSVQGLQTGRNRLVPAFLRDAMPSMPSWIAIPMTDSTSGTKPVGSGLKLFTACLVADHGSIRRQCSLVKTNRPAAAGSRRNLLLTREKTSGMLEIETVIDWQNVRPLLL